MSQLRTVILVLLFVLATSAWAQQHGPTPTRAPVQQRSQLQSPSVQRRAAPLYQSRNTWYEFLLKQFNPDDLDYGTWMEQRRQAFLDASVRNPYFKYSAGMTVALIIVGMLYIKHWVDHRRAMWITAEMMTDLFNHDTYSRGVAREAIQKYNDHIERCNRAIEAAEHGLANAEADSELARLRSQLESVKGERESYKRDRDLAKDDLKEKERLLADISFRLDALAAKRPDSNQNLSSSVDMRSADQKLVQHINNLQEQLCAAQLEIKRLRGER